MLAPRWRKVIGDLWSNKTRTALVVLSIAIGVFAIGMVAGGREILMRDLNGGWNAVHPSSASLSVDSIDEDLVQTIRRMPGIEDVEASRGVLVRAQSTTGEWKNLQLLVYPDFDDIRTYRPTPLSGQWPPERKAAVLERTTLPFLGVADGDALLIEMLNGDQYTLAVGGTYYNVGTFPTALSNTGYAYITTETAEYLGLPTDFNSLDIVVAEHKYDVDHIREVANQVQAKIEKSGREVYAIFILDPGVYPADDFVQALTLVLSIIGFFALMLSAFLVINTIGALLTQQVRQIGVMKSIGARNSDIVQLYLATVLAFGALSLFVAIPLGMLGAWGLAAFFASMFNFDIVSVVPPPAVLAQQIAAGLLMPVLAALVPVFGGTRITVREAIGSYGLGRGRFGRGRLDKLLEKIHFLSRPMLLSLRNTFRRKGRLALTLTTLTLAGVIFMAVITERTSLKQTVEDILQYYNSDVEIALSQPYRTTVLDQVRQVPGVTDAEYWSTYSARRLMDDDSEAVKDTTVLSLPADTFAFRPTVTAGRWLLPEDDGAAVVSSGFMTDNPDIKLGDTLRLKVKGKELSLRVVGLTNIMLDPTAYVYVNLPTFSRQAGDAGRAGSIRLLTERRETALQNSVAQQAKDLLKGNGIEVVSTLTETERRAQSNMGIDMVIVFLLMMAVLLAAVGGLGLMGTMSINVLERTREIGVMRAIGASDWSILRIVIVEGVLIGLISWAIGAVLALPLSLLINAGLEQVFEAQGLTFVFSLPGVALWLGIVVVLATLASFLPAWSASRVTVRDVLAYE